MHGMGGELRALHELAREAARSRKQSLSTAHLLVAMLQLGRDAGCILVEEGIRESELLAALKTIAEERPGAVEMGMERASKSAQVHGEKVPRAIHLLLVLTKDPRSAAYECLERCGVKSLPLSNKISALLSAHAKPSQSPPVRTTIAPPPAKSKRILPQMPVTPMRSFESSATSQRAHMPAVTPTRSTPPQAISTPPKRLSSTPPPTISSPEKGPETKSLKPFELDPQRYPILSALGRNLTQLAHEGKVDPVIGRDAELEKILDVLARRRANHPLLVGLPGVGKTAIVEGLAVKLAKNAASMRGFENTIVVEISAGSLVSGTGVRGALSEKLAKLRAEIAQEEGRILLFLDEIHAVIGGSDGPDDLSTELKAALARGEFPCIGATTEAEYRKYFEKDAALARRFSRIDIAEPSQKDAVPILRGIAARYEIHHAVAYTPDAIEQAVLLSVRFLPERQLPDKAISVLDLAAARTKRRGGRVVDHTAIAEVISEMAHVPLERLMMRDAERLLDLERLLQQRVVGQNEPISRISEALRKSAAGFRGTRPLGTFLLLGPTGVGKTETAKAISEILFGTPEMTRIDMSEYSESHAVARLLGAPPGYLGHDDGGQLTESVRRRPYQLILLDEIEKAHIEVLLSLLPLLDEGRMTDGRGRTVDFRNTVIVMTSNLGVNAVEKTSRIGFGDDSAQPTSAGEDKHLAAARRALPPELWNRIDEPLWFRALLRNDVREIAERMLCQVRELVAREHGITLTWGEELLSALADAGGFDAALGARPMRRTVGRLVESPFANAILSREILRGDHARITAKNGQIRIEKAFAVAAE